MSTTAPPGEAVARLHEAWRSEIEAQTVYSILAGRMRDPRRAQVIREIADAEGRHRERIEKRLRELGEAVADPSTVNVSAWSPQDVVGGRAGDDRRRRQSWWQRRSHWWRTSWSAPRS